MVYLNNTTEAQVLLIPRNGETFEGDIELVLVNTTDHRDTITPMADLETSGLYYNLAVTLPEGCADGEYEYTLKRGGMVASNGLAYIGELKGEKEYENIITYKQYESV